ncbi:hypothetical protein jhhlp_001871 [Lomentospora prolificans]|uniref:AAA+ ATPase domain-containing protein n=1 Tax=Lomentospora prolificans TaxID=41688 RepID=A0A2N3NCH2_9PEZI|nr:hypothetical protein jhhlp_001871 [Lomentospora prolificans]
MNSSSVLGDFSAGPPGSSGVASLLNNLLSGKAAPFVHFLEGSLPMRLLQAFFSKWQNIDIPTWTVAIAILGTVPNTLFRLRVVTYNIYWWIAKYFVSSISVAGNDQLNKDVINWVAHNVLPRRSIRMLNARTEIIQTDYWKPTIKERNDIRHENRVPVQYLPAFGTIWFIHKCSVFLISCQPNAKFRYHDNVVPIELSAAPEGHEPLVLMCLGRSVKPLKQFLDTCRDFAEEQRREYVTVRTSKKSAYTGEICWGSVALRPVRHMETVHFDEKVKQRLVRDITHYLEPSTRQYYVKRGIPYRRGYLLHGPPGTGKTSLSLALASYFKIDLYLCHLPSVKDDGSLEDQFINLPPKCIILLEDIDTVGVQRRGIEGDASDSDDSDRDLRRLKKKSKFNYSVHGPGCSLSGLLNVLDGVASQEGRIVLMTSNFADKLDKALVRPGRIDQMIYLGNISRASAEEMFLRMYAPSKSDTEVGLLGNKYTVQELGKLATKFSTQLPEERFTPAQIQGFLLGHKEEPHEAVAEIGKWVTKEVKIMEQTEAFEKANKERRRKKRESRKLAKLTHSEPFDRLSPPKRLLKVNGTKGDVSDDEGKPKENGRLEAASKEKMEGKADVQNGQGKASENGEDEKKANGTQDGN